MASLIRFFMSPDDELAFLRFLARHELEVYPERIPPDWKPVIASPETISQIPEEGGYLTAPRFGAVIADKVKRGPRKGDWRVDEVRSPVIHFGRCHRDGSELVAGQLWAELDVTPQTGRRDPAPELFRRLFHEITDWFRKHFRRSQPTGFWIGPGAARLSKQGLVLRAAVPKGPVIRPHG